MNEEKRRCEIRLNDVLEYWTDAGCPGDDAASFNVKLPCEFFRSRNALLPFCLRPASQAGAHTMVTNSLQRLGFALPST